MNLPALNAQLVYAHVAWGVVLAAAGLGVIGLRHPFPSRLATAWVVLAIAACAWPGPASPAYWLGLAFHFPSGLMVGLCALVIWRKAPHGEAARALPVGLAWTLLLAGGVLYLDSSGWLSLGLYARGFGTAAAVCGLVAGTLAVACVVRSLRRGTALAVLLAVLLFAVLRLPSGNAWDALLDPLLWLWSLFSLLARAVAWRRA